MIRKVVWTGLLLLALVACGTSNTGGSGGNSNNWDSGKWDSARWQ